MLVQLIEEKVKLPVIAAGGIAAALTLGEDAAQIGTAFLAYEESGALPMHKAALFSEQAYTMLTRTFTGRLGRGLRTRLAEDMIGKENGVLPFPLQTAFMSSLRKATIEQKKMDMLFFWAGQIAPLLKHRKASVLMKSLIEEITALLPLRF